MRECMVAVVVCLSAGPALADPCCTPPPQIAGGTMAFGAQTRTLPPDLRDGTTGPVFPQAYTIDQERTRSFWMAFGVERDTFVFATDMSFGGASISGMTRDLPAPPFTNGGAARPYATNLLESSLALRFGARTQIGPLAIAAGAGVGGTLYVATGGLDGPSGPNADWFIPVWAQATYKTSCDWGVQLLAESDRHDWDDQRSTGVALGLAYQPDSACEIGR